MNIPKPIVSLAAFSLGFTQSLHAADAPAKTQSGYTVVLEVKVDEKGLPEDARIINSDDPSAEHLLDRAAFAKVHDIKLAPRLKDGKAVKYTVQAPFVFTIEGDEGPEAPGASRPRIIKAIQPAYPADLAAKGVRGGVILEIVVGADGSVSNLKVLRSSDPAFESAATVAVQQWAFAPALVDGKPVASRWRMSLCFEIDDLSMDWTWRIAPRPSLGNYTVVHRTKVEEPPATPPVAAPSDK